MRTIHSLALCALAAGGLFACGGDDSSVAATSARPVTVLTLERSAPATDTLVPGVVVPYRQTDVAFEVGGRVARIVDVSTEVRGAEVGRDGEPLVNGDGSLVRAGDVIATIDPVRYERAVRQAELRLESARRELEASQVNLDQVAEARLDSARAQADNAELAVASAREDISAAESALDLATTTLERNRELQPSGAVSDIVVQQSENDVEAATTRLEQVNTAVTQRERDLVAARAAVAEAEGSKLLQRAQVDAQTAAVTELEVVLANAQRDLDDCVLRAPFTGRVTDVMVSEGTFVQAGAAVVTLTMMNPIKVEISTSASEFNQMVVGADATIFPSNGNEVDLERPMQATLFERNSVADEQTRTFGVGLIGANERRVPPDVHAGLRRVQYLLPILDNPLQIPGGGLFTISDAVFEDERGTALHRVIGLQQGSRDAESLTGRLTAERIPVELGRAVTRVANFTVIEVLSAETPESGRPLQRGDLVVAFPEEGDFEGFVVDDERWLLQPGALVHVALDQGGLPDGFYVPVQAVRELNGATTVFAVDEDGRARAIAVEVRESHRERRRIESPELVAGMQIVTKGTHFVADGEAVQVVAQER